MQEVIISQGYDPDQMDRVPQRVRHIAEVKSGLLIAQNKLAAARDELNTTRVTAPFDGIVANVKAHAGQLAQTGDVVCRVISPQQMEVEFRVMESDLGELHQTILVFLTNKTEEYECQHYSKLFPTQFCLTRNNS